MKDQENSRALFSAIIKAKFRATWKENKRRKTKERKERKERKKEEEKLENFA